MEYKLWDVESAHYIGKYADEESALATIGALVAQYGDDYAESLSLGRVAEDRNILTPLSGEELRARASEAAERKSSWEPSASRRACNRRA